MSDTLERMGADSEIGLRAYLYTTNPGIEFRPQKPPRILLGVGNSGQTPAHGVIIRARAYYGITPAQKERVGEYTTRSFNIDIPGAGAQPEDLKIAVSPAPDDFAGKIDAKPIKGGHRNINRRTIRIEGEILYRTVYTQVDEAPEVVRFDYGLVLDKSKEIAPGEPLRLKLDYPGKENESTHSESER